MQRQISNAPFFRQLFDRTSCTYTYLLADSTSRKAILIDPVDTEVERDLTLVKEHGLQLTLAINTHAHADHISGTGLIKQQLPTVQSVISKRSTAKADVYVKHGDLLHIGDALQLKVIETPGHTEGCVSYYVEGDNGRPGMVFTGDTLLIRGCGRTDFQGGSSETLFHSVRDRLFTLPADTIVYPAHDYRGQTMSTVDEELKFNPRLGKGKSLEEFVHIMANLKLEYPKMMDVAVPANLNCGIPPPKEYL